MKLKDVCILCWEYLSIIFVLLVFQSIPSYSLYKYTTYCRQFNNGFFTLHSALNVLIASLLGFTWNVGYFCKDLNQTLACKFVSLNHNLEQKHKIFLTMADILLLEQKTQRYNVGQLKSAPKVDIYNIIFHFHSSLLLSLSHTCWNTQKTKSLLLLDSIYHPVGSII